MKNQERILLVGGGSGGHLTPLIAVAEALKNLNANIYVMHIGQRNENLSEVITEKSIDVSYAITAGKFRRYHGTSFLSHVLDIRTMMLNFRDFFRFVAGTYQAWRLLGKCKPDSIMLKGGFVCVPVGFAARLRRIPYITHDSDAVPGLANRITAKNATYNTTALPVEIYPYEQKKAIQVGIPIRKEFTYVSEDDMKKSKVALGLDPQRPVLFCVGGGLGAQRVNKALVAAMPNLMSEVDGLYSIHLTGKKLYEETMNLYKSTLSSKQLESVKLIDFTTDLYAYSSAADLVLTRGGATNIAEFAAQAKTCIVVPNPMLTGGQQLHNANVLSDANAAIIVHEDTLDSLGTILSEQFKVEAKSRVEIGMRLHKLAVPNSAERIAELLHTIATQGVTS